MKAHLRYEALTIFKTFDKKEFIDFGQFISIAPFLNTIGGKFTFGNSSERKKHSIKLAKFFTLLKSSYPDFTDLTNTYLMKKMGTNSISTIKKYFVQLKLLCDHFLVFKEISIDKYYYDEALLYQYQGRLLNKHFDIKYNDVLKQIDTPHSYNLKDFLMKFNFGVINFMRIAPEIKLRTNNDLKKVMDLQLDPSFNLLFHFIFDSIKIIVNLIAHANSYAFKLESVEFYTLFKKSFPNEVLEYIIKKAIQLTSSKTTKKIIELYWLKYLFRTTEGKDAAKYFKQYIVILDITDDKLSRDERYDFYHERNFGFWLGMKYPEFENDEFKLYDLYLNNKAYKASGKDKLQLMELKNLIVRGDNTKRFEWTSKVLKKYIHEVEPEYQDILLHFRNAGLFFQRDKNYTKALEELREIEKKGQHTMTRDILHLYILIYYEIGYYDSALSSIDSLRKYLTNQHIGLASAKPVKKFITCVKKLIENTINKTDDYEKILTIINENNLIISKKWLLEKISEHRSKKSYKKLA